MPGEVLSKFPQPVLPLPRNFCISMTSWDWLDYCVIATAARQ